MAVMCISTALATTANLSGISLNSKSVCVAVLNRDLLRCLLLSVRGNPARLHTNQLTNPSNRTEFALSTDDSFLALCTRRFNKASHVGGGFTAETAPEVLPKSRITDVHATVDPDEELSYPVYNNTGELLHVCVELWDLRLVLYVTMYIVLFLFSLGVVVDNST